MGEPWPAAIWAASAEPAAELETAGPRCRLGGRGRVRKKGREGMRLGRAAGKHA